MANPGFPSQMSADRAPLAPMNGKPSMVHVVANVEYWPFDQPLPRTVMPAPHGKSPVPDVCNYSWVAYGMRVGMRRVMRILDEGSSSQWIDLDFSANLRLFGGRHATPARRYPCS